MYSDTIFILTLPHYTLYYTQVPGEGEHKVMDMIRLEQRESEEFRLGKMKNCMYGLDAGIYIYTTDKLFTTICMFV